MMVGEVSRLLDIDICVGGCGLSVTRHREGCIDPFGTVHFAERRRTKRALRNLLLLVARRDREADAEYLNVEVFDFFYQYSDSIAANRMALQMGIRLPAALFNHQREMCRLLAARRGVKLTRYRKVYEWSAPR